MNPLRALLTDTMRSVGLLTRVPVAARWFEGFDGRYDRAARAFPVVGVLLALPIAATAWAAAAIGLPPLAAGLLAIGLGIVLTGALHEDGLADTFDGLGGRDRERRLEIMRDSAIGTYGVLALVVTIGLRATALGALAYGSGWGIVAVLAAFAASRAAMVWLWGRTPPARTDGAAAASGRPTADAVRVAVALAAVPLVGAAFALGPWPVLVATAAVVAVATALRRYALRSLGGHTGDALGACVGLSETAALLALAAGAPAADMIGS